MSLISKEPAAFGALLMTVVNSAFPVLAELKVPLTVTQQAAIAAVLGALVTWWVRSRVSPVKPPQPPGNEVLP